MEKVISVLDGAPKIGFTEHAAKYFGTVVPVDEVSEAEARLLQARMDFSATVSAIKGGKQTAAVRRAVMVSGS